MQPLHVYDDELLYRSVRPGEFTVVNGRTVFSASAFNDREKKPSVDKQWYGRTAEATRKSPENGVLKLVAGDTRQTCKVAIFDSKGKAIDEHAVDVMHRPIIDDPTEVDNPAHCQIECNPAIEKDGSFKRLKEALAGLATKHGFVLQPGTAPDGAK
jgi:hypothetical protein